MYVVATAGHVDHGKSTLVEALTAMDPDRWDEEKERGLTIDLGFVWTRLPSGADLAFVDVPGHERFLGNMLAGVGPASVVLFVVAADEGWQQQTTDHRDALAAFGISRGVVALTRADRAGEERRAEVTATVRENLAGTALADAPVVAVSARTGEGLDRLRGVLDEVLAGSGAPGEGPRLRLWLDRAFSVKGAGTVVTGTLVASALHTGDELELVGHNGTKKVTVRGLQSENRPVEELLPITRAAANLRGVGADEIHRGDALVGPGQWPVVEQVDVRRVEGLGRSLDDLPEELAAHIGTAQVTAHVRPLNSEHARLTFSRGLPLMPGDRFVLRGPGSHHVLAGVTVLDVAPPPLARRGAGRRRGAELAGQSVGDPAPFIQRNGWAAKMRLRFLGYSLGESGAKPPQGIIEFKDWWIHAPQVRRWKEALLEALDRHTAADPLSAGLPRAASRKAIGVEDDALLNLAIAAAKVESADGVVRRPEPKGSSDLGAAEPGVQKLEKRLTDQPFAAPDAGELADLGLGTKELAAAERAGRILRLPGGSGAGPLVLLPSAPQEAARRLRALEPGFTLSAARRVLGTTRRVAVPLLEHLDAIGATRRVGNTRELR